MGSPGWKAWHEKGNLSVLNKEIRGQGARKPLLINEHQMSCATDTDNTNYVTVKSHMRGGRRMMRRKKERERVCRKRERETL